MFYLIWGEIAKLKNLAFLFYSNSKTLLSDKLNQTKVFFIIEMN